MAKRDLIGVKEAAALLGIDVSSMYTYRWQGIGPKQAGKDPADGRRVLYDRAEVERWVEAGRCKCCGQTIPMHQRDIGNGEAES